MSLTRRHTLAAGLGSAAAAGLIPGNWFSAFAQSSGDALMAQTISTNNGDVSIAPINHASLALIGSGLTIFIDPVGDVAQYAHLPKPDLILVTHEHGDHFNTEVLLALTADKTTLVTNPAVFEKLPETLQLKAHVMKNGDIAQLVGTKIEAIAAYNTTADRTKFHPKGRDNGYIVTINATRIYIAGDTEDIPEMRALSDIALAFVPMNLPYTMDIDQAADAVLAFAPKVVYPYHYKGSDIVAFKAAVEAKNAEIEVRLHDWYAA
jgi:L-ascorbate metabolism protein UlaG (beta-lactamase superfamily)